MAEDVVDDLHERAGRVDHHACGWEVFLRPVESEDEVALGGPGAPLVPRALLEPSVEGVRVDVEDEDLVEDIEDHVEVAGATAEEGCALLSIGSHRSDAVDVPDVVLVVGRVGRLTCSGFALVGELCVTVDCLVAAALQLRHTEVLPEAETPSTR
jgi:hypothetical protein